MALNPRFLVALMIRETLVFTFVFVAVRRCLIRRQSLIPGLVGLAFTHRWNMLPSKKLKITAFSCDVPRYIAALVMRILAMCFQMGRNQLGFAIASIRLHLIFKEMGEQTKILSENGSFDLLWREQMAGGGH